MLRAFRRAPFRPGHQLGGVGIRGHSHSAEAVKRTPLDMCSQGAAPSSRCRLARALGTDGRPKGKLCIVARAALGSQGRRTVMNSEAHLYVITGAFLQGRRGGSIIGPIIAADRNSRPSSPHWTFMATRRG